MVREMKHTEIGDIPVDWELQTFEETFRVLSNNTLSRDNLNNRDGAVRNIHYGDILTKFPEVLDCREEDIPYINDLSLLTSSTQLLQDGDIVIADTAEDDAVGKVTEIQNLKNGKLVAGLHTIPCRVKKGMFSPGWLGYYMNSHIYHDQVLPFVTGIKVSSVSKSAISETWIAIPPIEEQIAIVASLKEIDAVISASQKLVSKKKEIKLGLLQTLLSPDYKLEGFSQTWITDSLLNVSTKIGVGLATSVTEHYRSSGVPIFRNLNIKENFLDDEDILFLDEGFAAKNPSKVIHTGDVLTVHTGYVGTSCVVPEKYDGAMTFTTLITSTKKNILLPEYLAYHLNSPYGHKEVENLQASGGRNNLNVSDFEQYTICFPKDISEQRAIISILEDADKDIAMQIRKLDKQIYIKSGMINELISGKKRLL